MIDTLRKDFFMDNIFLKNQASETLDSFLSYSEGGRDNLGNTIPVMVYRMLEYSLKLELVNRLGKEGELLLFDDEEHTLTKKQNQVFLSNSILNWFDTYLK